MMGVSEACQTQKVPGDIKLLWSWLLQKIHPPMWEACAKQLVTLAPQQYLSEEHSYYLVVSFHPLFFRNIFLPLRTISTTQHHSCSFEIGQECKEIL